MVLALAVLLAGNIASAQEAPPTPPALPTEDLGSATVPLSASEPSVDTILAALAEHTSREASGLTIAAATTDAGLAPFDIPPRIIGSGLTIFAPLVGGPLERGQQVVTPTPTQAPVTPLANPADVTVAIWPEPSIRVARNGTLTYELRLFNDGSGDARTTRVSLPFDPRQLTVVSSRLDRGAGDWVSEVRSDRVVVTFGELDARSRRSGFVTFRVAAGLTDNTVLSMRPSFRVTDGRGTREESGNWAPVLAGGGNDSGGYVWMIVQPVDGRVGELRTFFTNRFAPGETVTTWLNTPQGVRELSVRAQANTQGHTWLEYRPSGLVPGVYQLVAYGNQSRLTGVASFIVR